MKEITTTIIKKYDVNSGKLIEHTETTITKENIPNTITYPNTPYWTTTTPNNNQWQSGYTYVGDPPSSCGVSSGTTVSYKTK